MLRTVFNNFEIANMNSWRGEAHTAFFNYPDHDGGFYYQVCPSLLLVNITSIETLCTNSDGATRQCTRSEHRYSGARMGSISSGRSDTNIIRSRIALKTTCGSVVDVLATRNETLVCDKTLSSLAHSGSLMFLCLDYLGGWSCLPKWEQAIDQHQEQ